MVQKYVDRHLLSMSRTMVDLPDEQAIFGFVRRNLLKIPGVAAVRYNSIEATETQAQPDIGTITMPLTAGEITRGELRLTVSEEDAFAPYRNDLSSFCSLLAVTLEERAGRRQKEEYRRHLKQMVQERIRRFQTQIEEKEQIEEALRRNRRLLNDTQAISKTGSWEYDVATRKMIWSEETYRIYDLPFTADPGKAIRCHTYYSPSDQQRLSLAFQEAREQGKSFDLELPFTTGPGDKKWVRTTGQARIQDGRVASVFGNVADITEQMQAEMELKTASQKWRSTFDSMLDPVAYLDLDGRVEQCNRAFADFCGQDITAMKGRKCYELIHHVHDHVASCPLVRLRHSGKRETMELMAGDRALFVVADPVFAPDGRVIGVVHIIRNITERKRAEEALRESDEKYRLVTETAHDFIITTDMETRITFVNRAVYDFLQGLDPIGLKIGDFIPPAGQARHREMMALRSAGIRDIFSFEWEILDPDGRLHTLDVHSQIIMENSKPSGILFVARDVTGRKKAEEDIRTLNERYELAAGSAGIGIWDRDLLTNQIVWDSRMYALYGISPEQFTRTPEAWRALIHPEDKLRVDETLRRMILSEKDYDTEFRIIRPDGRIRHIKAYGRVQRNENGRAVRLIGVNYDITWRKEAEEERRKLEKQLFEAQKMEAVGTLAGGIAHDFNNILAAIIGYAELARDTREDDRREEQIHRLLLAAGRAKDLINQILTFSRRTENAQKLLDMKIIVKEEIKLLRATMPAAIDIRQRIPNIPFIVNADITQMHQVIMNIITNAAHALGEKGGTIEVTIDRVNIAADPPAEEFHLPPGPYVKLSIADTGPGIQPEIINRIFEPFFTTKGIGEGTGLGLSVVYGIVKNHQGAVHVASTPGTGAEFHIYLPAVEEAKPVREESSRDILPRGKEKILFVDDEKDLAELARIRLTRLGYQVTICRDSLEALNLFQNDPDHFDLIITDMNMPQLSGSDLAQRIFNLRPDQPVILCTGYSSYINAEKAAQMGIKSFLFKPVSKRDLAWAIRNALDNHPVEQSQ